MYIAILNIHCTNLAVLSFLHKLVMCVFVAPLRLCLVLCMVSSISCSETYYVTPDDSCPPWPLLVPCKTLQQYALNASDYFTSDTTFIFFDGTHDLTIPIHVELAGSDGGPLQLRATGEAVITCREPLSLSFSNISDMTVDGLKFVGCGSGSQPALYFSYVASLNLLGLALCDNDTADVKGYNVGTVTIINCNFGCLPIASSKTNLYHHLQLITDSDGPYISRVNITNSSFYSSCGGAINITINSPQYGSQVYIDNILTVGPFREGNAMGVAHRAAVLVEINSTQYHTLKITNSQLLYSLSRAVILTMLDSNGDVLIRNCTVKYSQGGALEFNIYYVSSILMWLQIENSTISDNTLYGDTGAGSAIFVRSDKSELVIRETIFDNNVHIDSQGPVQSTVYVADMTTVSFSNCKFHSNRATAILVARGTISVSGYIEFYNNTGYQGGGCALYDNSQMKIASNTLLNFTSNQASNVGGALFILEDFVPFTQTLPNPCFFQVANNVRNISLLFINNTAMYGGNAIYGESIENCSTGMSEGRGGTTGGNVLTQPGPVQFHFEPNSSSDISVISSQPSRVCVCENGHPNCSKAYISTSVIPGQAITLPLVTVGHWLGAVRGLVFARVLLKQPNQSYHIAGDARSQPTSAQQCQNINFAISSSANTAIAALTSANVTVPYFDSQILNYAMNNLTTIQEVFLSFPVYVNISFLDCSLGSLFDEESHMCRCSPVLTNRDVQCNILGQTVSLPGNVWVSVSLNSSGGQTGIIVQPCKLQYCIEVRNNISLQYPDTQCAHNRSGILCGGCSEGLSLTLGPPTCQSCSNTYLLLFFLFTLNGILLVFFIKLLNLTVAAGTINGVIFYANIVWANRNLFFDTGKTTFPLVFIAWLNLDLGVLTCFYDGLDMYVLTWLQYVFPIYICFLAMSIIVLAHYSSCMAKILGTNSVPVLATLFLLIYNKILRNIINSLKLTQTEWSDGSSRIAWTLDGNYEYLGGQHIYLFVAAVFLLVCAWLPYTVTLLLGQWLLRLPYNLLCRYIKPFLDAYYGPLQDRYRFWVGLMLLLRCAILLVFALDPLNTGALDLLVILIVALLLLYLLTKWQSVYKNKYVNQLEISFLLNLAILAGVQLYMLVTAKPRRAAAIQTSVYIVFVKFVLILFYHTYCQLRHVNIVKSFEVGVKNRLPSAIVNTSQDVVGTITLSDSLQIESMYSPQCASNESSSPPTSASGDSVGGIRRLLTTISRRPRAHQNTRSRGHRGRLISHSTVAMGDSMETDLSHVRNVVPQSM